MSEDPDSGAASGDPGDPDPGTPDAGTPDAGAPDDGTPSAGADPPADDPSSGGAGSPDDAGSDWAMCMCCSPVLGLAPDPAVGPPPSFPPAPTARGPKLTNTLAQNHDVYPNLPRTPSSVGGQFDLAAQNYALTIYGELTYVKGWIQWLIQLDALVPPGTGGGGKANFGPPPAAGGSATFSGTDWRYAKASLDTVAGGQCSASGYWFWDGAKWQDVPAAFVDVNNVKLLPIGIWPEGSTNRAQIGDGWPEKVPAWGPDEEASCKAVLPYWINTIQTTWSNKFDLKRQDCPGNDPACCRYPPTVVAAFTEMTTFPIDLKKSIVLGGNQAARSNVRAWSLKDGRKYMPAHEFGHLLGYPDEYPGGVGVDTSVNEDGATKGIDNGSLMGLGMNAEATAIVKKRHYRVVCWQLSTMVDTAAGLQKCLGHEFKAEDKL